MKTKVNVLLLASALLVGLGFVIMLKFNHSSNNSEPKVEAQTIRNELEKNFSVIKIVNIVGAKAVDAFGEKLKVNEWYVQSNITLSVFRINTKSTNYTRLSQLMANGEKATTRIKTTNGDPMGAYVDAEILLLGDEVLVLSDLEQYQVVSIR